ncbi:MAG: hypothetical protein QOF62_2163 [Pyrinomonadaceae bacterium]|jgi:hypothetical protein|nr:hypothetical protein [Pyrinomonadaceae bacterium]
MPNMTLSNQPPHSSPSPPQRFHGVQPTRGLEDVPRSTLYEGRFGRMFRNLAPFAPEDADLLSLGGTMIETQPQADDPTLDNPDIPAGFTYLGQFIDHDITFDPNSKLQRDNDPDALRNFRTPRYDLDSVYADGPDNNPFLYDADGMHLLVGKNAAGEDDLPRNAADPRRALTGDPRNDENAIVSQLHLAFIRFHNKVLDGLPANMPNRFDEARRIVRWHYQWVVLHDFLRKILGGDDVVNDIVKLDKYKVPLGGGTRDIQGALNVDLKFYHFKNQPFIPVEFAVAAYRFGHSMIRTDYELNPATKTLTMSTSSATRAKTFAVFRNAGPAWKFNGRASLISLALAKGHSSHAGLMRRSPLVSVRCLSSLTCLSPWRNAISYEAKPWACPLVRQSQERWA